MSDAIRDIRVGLRGLRRTPTFTIAAVLILGLGIGTASAMFTVFRAVLVERLPVRDPERVVVLNTYIGEADDLGISLGDLKQIRASSRTLRNIGGFAHWGTTPGPLADGDRTLIAGRVIVSGDFFDVLGGRPLLGRFIRPEDDAPGVPRVMVLSYKVWQQEFNGDTAVVGRHLFEPYGQVSYTIVGVAPPGLDYPAGAGYWIPPWPNSPGLSVVAIGRLAQGATPAAAKAELLAIVQRLHPDLHLGGSRAVGFVQAVLGDVRPVLTALTAAVGLLLLIACVNVGNLLLLRAGARARELAIRRAVGATYGDVVRHLLIESTLLAVAGGLLGVVCAEVLRRALIVFAPPQLPRLDMIQVSGAPLAIALGVTIVTVLMFGLVPSLVAARSDVASTLRSDSRSGRDSTKRRRLRQVLVASQTMLALVMVAGGLLLARSLSRLQAINLGYKADRLSLLAASWPSTKYDTNAKLFPVGEEIVRRWRSIPGVIAVTTTMIPTLVGPNVFLGPAEKEGQPAGQTSPFIPVESGGDEYFRTFGIPIKRGRGFTDADREGAQYVAVISESAARQLWPNEDPIGKRIKYWSPLDSTAWRTIVGVTGDVRLRALREVTPTIFVPWRQSGFWQGNFAIRTSGPLGDVLPAIRRELAAAEPSFKLWYIKTMDDLLDAPLAQPRMSALLMSAFGAAALILAAIGLYGLMASIVRERTRELGIRMALGASPERLRRDVLSQALMVSGAGAVVGVIAALTTSRLLTALLFEVSPTDPLALGAACVTLLLVVLIAAYVPARSATKVNPVTALRAD